MKTVTIDLPTPVSGLALPKIEYVYEEQDNPQKPKIPLGGPETLPLSVAEAIELREQFVVEMSEAY
ncbi:MAG: hypothetical protein OXU64_13150 [Gemmatimonadota bacterium]|nr:hypothetical protein [Gemmatimonadota bacterium]